MRLAARILNLAIIVLPQRRRIWGEAMQAELSAMPDQQALGFAVGCLATAFHERMISMSANLPKVFWGAARAVVVTVTLLWGLYWMIAPWLFIRTNGMTAATQSLPVILLLAAIAIRGLCFVALAYALARWKAGWIVVLAVALVPLSLADTIFNLGNSWHLWVRLITIGIELTPLCLVSGAAAIFWRNSHLRMRAA